MPIILPEALLSALLWTLVALVGQMAMLILVGAWIQVRRDRFARFRIACHRRWEEAIVAYLYQEGHEAAAFHRMNTKERRLFVPFLVRVLGIFSGSEGERVRTLYQELRLDQGLAGRLRSRFSRTRGMAALEVGHFQVETHYTTLRERLGDPVPHVAHAAACSLASTQNVEHAEAVIRWMLTQEVFQRDRLLWILEAFGPSLLPWMEARMDGTSETDPLLQELYALLAGSLRSHSALPRVLSLLHSGTLEVQAAALKALGALGNPESFTDVLPLVEHEAWVLRGQAAKVLGILGGSEAIPHLARLMGDPVYDVRRNAAYALSQLGSNGIKALERIASDADGDPFARDLASERLQWAHVRGR